MPMPEENENLIPGLKIAAEKNIHRIKITNLEYWALIALIHQENTFLLAWIPHYKWL